MKTKLLVLALVGIFAFSSVQAQEQGDMRASIGLALGSIAGIDTNNGEFKMGLGITPGFEYVFVDAMSANASYDFYFKTEENGGEYKYSSFNIDYRYYFMTDDLQVYGLAGLGFVKVDLGAAGSASDTGLNLGLGAIYPIADAVGIHAQLKYNTKKAQDFSGDEKANLAINIGATFMF
ncbi:MAG: outer membrane beta-barrel protein [Reichenbachiella sp.]|uniref:outer membrane beta-barrel protein n=1 Tax=Reichenbachiella sp. TaxID=2184521 RepID=UPI003262FEC1